MIRTSNGTGRAHYYKNSVFCHSYELRNIILAYGIDETIKLAYKLNDELEEWLAAKRKKKGRRSALKG